MPAPLLLRNARILTQDPASPIASEMLIEDGRIRAIGLDSTFWPVAGVRRLDLAGRTVVAGFNDCHMHILPYGLDLARADLSPAAGVVSIPALVRALRRWSNENPRSAWILGGRYDQNTFPGAAHPTRHDLDAAFPDRPVWITQTSKHGGAANTLALALAGITRDTPDPDDGQIVRNADGEPTGVLLESAMDLMADVIPAPTQGELTEAVLRANRALARHGITSASDLNTGTRGLRNEMEAYRTAAEREASVRTTLFPHLPMFGRPEDIPDRFQLARELGLPPDGHLRLGGGKLFSDGALTVRTAALREPYVDGSGVGMLLHAPEELREYIEAAHRSGWQVATHAIGDRAVELVLDCYARLEGFDRRHRIEHAMLLDEDLIRRFRDLGVIPVLQPEFIARLGDAYIMGLGEERAARLNPAASLLRAGIGVAFSSDCPIVPGRPLDGIRAAVRREAPSGKVLGPGEALSPSEALRCYTVQAAYASFDEGETGALMVGMRADLAILSADPTTPDGLESAEVEATIAGGEIVYGEESL